MNALNAERYVREALDSVYAQTVQDWEIVFWDNASTDETGEIARQYDDRLRYYRAEETVPLGAARNQALARVRGDMVAFLDTDDLWLPEKLERQLDVMDRRPDVGIVFSNTEFFNQATGRSRLAYRKPPPQGMVFSELLSDYFLSLETVMVRREAIEAQEEWFDERFQMIEEADLFTRIAHDWPVAYVSAPLARWRIHPDSWTWSRSDLFATELELMLAKFQRLYPDIRMREEHAIRRLKARIGYRSALDRWRHGDRSGARSKLKGHLTTWPVLIVPYLLTLLPYEVYQWLLRLRMRSA